MKTISFLLNVEKTDSYHIYSFLEFLAANEITYDVRDEVQTRYCAVLSCLELDPEKEFVLRLTYGNRIIGTC